MLKVLPALTAAVLATTGLAAPSAGDVTTVTDCGSGPKPPLVYHIDCTNVASPDAKAKCATFLQNQACRVVPVYRKITGIKLEDLCKDYTYVIYDQDKWPEKGGDAGGLTGRCRTEYMTQYSVGLASTGNFGPYDTHEILHAHQSALGAIPYSHIFFAPSQAEATRLLGDVKAYDRWMGEMKKSVAMYEKNYQAQLQKGRAAQDLCVSAELNVEARLYLASSNNVYRFYRELEIGRQKDMADREARFNRMYDKVSGGKERAFLLSHGCGPF